MENINQNIAHIYCSKCDTTWQVLNEDGTDWDEEKTVKIYKEDIKNCNLCN
jgi:hypothetical protein